MTPSVGRIVHYTNLGDRDGRFPPEVQAALITKAVPRAPWNGVVDDGAHIPLSVGDAPGVDPRSEEERYSVSLHIFSAMGTFIMKDVRFTTAAAGSEDARGKWTWPARV